jgi:ABC-type multidrug transport system fused ATPase/permease subunit
MPAWQRRIGYIPQDIYLIDDSIRRNIAFGLADEDIDDNAVERSIRTAQLDSFIESLPEGAETTVGNRGIRLSGGQRQRIGIARALYRNPEVLVMDEATSALDSESERAVVAAISKLQGDRTIIMIAHRLSTVEGCDRIYLLEEGRVKDSGRMSELMMRHISLRPHPPASEAAASEPVSQ